MNARIYRAATLAGATLLAAMLAACGGSSPNAGVNPSSDQPLQTQSYGDSAFAYAGRTPEGLLTASSPRLPGTAPDATTPKVVGGYIVTVVDVTGTPCFNCVNGKTAGTFGSGDPLGYVNTTLTKIGILQVYFDVSYTGSCAVSIAVTQGTKTLATGSGSATPSPGGVETVELHTTRQSTWHGVATMTGKVVCGTLTVVNKGTVYFQ
ncbi:MAG: hypothetical protein ABI282_06855 [Candidatus Baltobacteraceae bacterium]